ncbi:DUF4236 domain-containing protein [Mucilaginibacter sp. PAMB04168]|uniref:DUF4236 domain-containing protein n=1 Tax=Mucilaginibacter sp. PAMB04168 TaxID=3138567 RepID=UPI0031F6A3B6
MGWSYRKSFGSGPFRINFSKGGISYSVGVKGARVNFSPKGTYVNLSSHGISYRRKISGPANPSSPASQEGFSTVPAIYEPAHTIASAAIGQLTDTDSKDFVQELSHTATMIAYRNWLGVFPFVTFLLVLLYASFESRTSVSVPATDSTLVRVTSYPGVYIRKKPSARSQIVKAAINDQTFLLADPSDSKWIKVIFKDTVGYISRRFTTIEHIHHDQVNSEVLVLSNNYAGYELLAGCVFFILLIGWLNRVDKKRLQMELYYEMDEEFQKAYQEFGRHFTTFSGSAKIWQYLNTHRTSDFKRNAGAGQLIKRTPIGGIAAHRVPLRFFSTNISIPYLKLSNLELYFLPERLLIKRGNTFAAVFYRNIQISGSTTRFIEDESLPRDAQVVDQTWRYVNKSGGPDRRFSNNRQIPICAYSEYTLRSETGVYEVLTTSKKGAMDNFANFILHIGQLQSRLGVS